jgi:hypothetical protein
MTIFAPYWPARAAAYGRAVFETGEKSVVIRMLLSEIRVFVRRTSMGVPPLRIGAFHETFISTS